MAEGQGQRVSFKCKTNDHWPVFVVGNVRELGGWAVEQALPMQRQDTAQNGQEWTAQVLLQHGMTVEYKFIKKTDRGVDWEIGENRRYTVIPGDHTISDVFRD